MDIFVPLGVLFLSVLLGIVFFKQAFSERKIKTFKLIFVGTFIVAYLLIITVFYKDIKNDEFLSKFMDYFYFGSYIILGLSFTISTSNNVTKKFLYSEYYRCIEQEKLFILIDKNDKVKEISSVFLKAFKTDDNNVIGEKFTDLFDKKFILSEINDQEFNNSDLRRIFQELKSLNEPTVYNREFKVYDRISNKPYVIKFSDHIIIENNKYRGHILIGDSKTGEEVLNVESKLKEKETHLEDIKLRFTTHLELTEEGIFFYNLDDSYIWGNDILVKMLHLTGNSIKRDEFLRYIHKDDLDYYLNVINSLTIKDANYDIKYRFKTGANYSYVREYGKRLYSANQNEIMGYITLLDTKHYERSNIKELDEIKSNEEMMVDLSNLYKIGRNFQLVTLRIDNIEDININHSRDIGNLVMAEYLKAIKSNFVEEGMIYRVSGLEFSFILTDYRKMDLLQKALAQDKILHAIMKYGSIDITTDVYMGITSSNDARTPEDLYKASRISLKASLNDQVRTNYIYYKDIR